MILGIIIAIVGIVILLIFMQDDIKAYNLFDFTVTFLPKLTIIVLVETFAYFFLRMYKHNLDEIKYFQNEATSIEHRLQALSIAIYLDDKDTIKDIILHHSKIDINNRFKTSKENMPLSLDYLVKIIENLKNEKENHLK